LNRQNQFWKPVVNLDKLWSLVPAEKRDEYLQKKTDKAPVLDLLSLGYSKVLGKGRLPNVPIVVRARYVSKEAEKKSKAYSYVIDVSANSCYSQGGWRCCPARRVIDINGNGVPVGRIGSGYNKSRAMGLGSLCFTAQIDSCSVVAEEWCRFIGNRTSIPEQT
jgi:hypothetical protein